MTKATKRPKTRAQAEAAVRRKARELLTAALRRWRPIRVKAQWNPDRPGDAEDWTFRIERDATGEPLLDIAMRDVAPEMRQTIVSLVKMLDEQALLIGVAAEVARVDLAADAGRVKGRTTLAGEKLKREKELKDEVLAAHERNTRRSANDIAETMCDRYKDRDPPLVYETFRKDVAKWIKEAKISGKS